MARAGQMTGAAAGGPGPEAAAPAAPARRPRAGPPQRGGGPVQGRAGARGGGRRRLKSGEALVKVLWGMRGGAMKVGQTLSAVGLGLVPEEMRADFQAVLAELRHSAEPVSFKAIRGVVEDELGAPLAEL